MKLINVWMVVMMFVGVVVADDGGSEKDHNGKQQMVLCELLKVAVREWEGMKEKSPEDPLKKALKQTIFGYGGGGTLEELKKGLPDDYKKEGADRYLWCGGPFDDSYGETQARWSGHSAPHDMVCLCTTGEKGWPFTDARKTEIEKLCGQTSDALGGGTDGWKALSWWGDRAGGKDPLTSTWTNVTGKCFEGDGKRSSLKEALKTFTGTLVNKTDDVYRNRCLLGEGSFSDSSCNGSESGGVCVMYYPVMTPQIWWKDLRNAIEEDEKIQKRLAEEEAEKRKKQEEAKKQKSHKTAPLISGAQTTNKTEQSHRESLTKTIRSFNMHSGTPITPPCSWFLSTALVI